MKCSIIRHNTEVGMRLCFPRSETLLVVVPQQLVQEVYRFVGDVPLILRRNKPRPSLLRVAEVPRVKDYGDNIIGGVDSLPKDLIILRVQGNVVFLDVLVQPFCAEYLSDLDELVVVVMTVEEWFLSEDLGHAE